MQQKWTPQDWSGFGGILSGLGTGLLKGDSWGEGLGMGFEQANAGMDRWKRGRAAQGMFGSLAPEQQIFLGDNPEIATSLMAHKLQQQLFPPKPPTLEPTARMQELQSMGLRPGTPEYKAAMMQIMMPKGLGGSDYEQRAHAAIAYGLDPNSDMGKTFVLTGKMPREDQTQLTATDKRALYAAEDELPNLDATIQTLDRAIEVNPQAYTGWTAGARGWLGSSLPDWAVSDVLAEPGAAAATREFTQLTDLNAIQSMANTLKGATTDFELNKFQQILADPSTPPEIRQRTLERLRGLAQRQRAVLQNRVQELRGGQGLAPVQQAQEPEPTAQIEDERVLNGKRYVKSGGQWYEVPAQ